MSLAECSLFALLIPKADSPLPAQELPVGFRLPNCKKPPFWRRRKSVKTAWPGAPPLRTLLPQASSGPEQLPVKGNSLSEIDVATLFSQTLQGEYDDDLPWEAVDSLRRLGTPEVFDRAVKWCRSPNDKRRARGVDVLAQIGSGSDAQTIQSFRQNALPIILELLEGEKAARPMASAIYALGHLALPTAISTIVNYAKHFNPDVRHAVAFALGSFALHGRSIHRISALQLSVKLPQQSQSP